VKRKVLWDNPLRMYNLDAARLIGADNRQVAGVMQ
jgi:hypothetical protein